MKEYIYEIYRDKNLTIKFGIIGAIGFVCNFMVLKTATDQLDLNKILAELIAAAIALHVTFLLHDKWTYRINKTVHKYHLKFSQRYRAYLLSNSFASLLTVIFFAIFSTFLSHLPALALAALAGLTWNFFVNKKIIWHHKPH
ncbi:MAG: GtrA family protein [Patescibacteria group bacterium]